MMDKRMEEHLTQLISMVAKLNGRFDDVRNDIDAVRNDISNLRQEMSDLRQEMNDRFELIEQRLDVHRSLIVENYEDIEILKKRSFTK